MSYDNDQNEPNLPVPGSSDKRKSESFLPRFFRTPSNKKFLNSTLDQLIQPGVVENLMVILVEKQQKLTRRLIIILAMFQMIELTISLNQLQLLKII